MGLPCLGRCILIVLLTSSSRRRYCPALRISSTGFAHPSVQEYPDTHSHKSEGGGYNQNQGDTIFWSCSGLQLKKVIEKKVCYMYIGQIGPLEPTQQAEVRDLPQQRWLGGRPSWARILIASVYNPPELLWHSVYT